MLKGFVSGEEKDIVRIPMKGKNLCAIPNVSASIGNLTVAANGDTFSLTGTVNEISRSNNFWKRFDFVLSAGEYAIKLGVPRSYQSGYSAYLVEYDTGTILASISGASASAATFTLPNDTHVYIGFYIYNKTLSDDKWILMLNLGSTALPYEPYGYQEGWEVRDNQDRLIWGRELAHYGFKIDKSNDDPEDAVIYTHDAVTMTPAHMDFTNDRFDYGSWGNAFFVRDCYPVALNLDGTEAYRLDPDDYTKKIDGAPSDIFYELLTEEPSDWSTQWKQYYTKSGDEYVLNSQSEAPTFATDIYYKLTYTSSFTGNFMMAFPKVWFYRHEDSQYNYIEISNHRLSNDWKCYAHINANGQEVDFIYLPLFKGVIKDSKLRSLPGQIPQGNTTATTEANAATALGSRWQIWDHSSAECLNDLLTLMSKSIDSQGRFGQGRSSGYDSTDTVTYGKLQTGTLIKKGKFHGYSATTKEVKVFGIEGFWANRWDRLQGMLLANNVWKIKMTPPYNFTGTDFVTLSNAEVPSGNGYLSKVQTSEYGSIPASIANGSSTKYFKDYFYKTATDTRVALRGGSCYHGGACGFRYFDVYDAASSSLWSVGASPVYK